MGLTAIFNRCDRTFDLAKDQNTATSQSITVDGAGVGRVITVQIRVTGENGVVSTGFVSFDPNRPNPLLDPPIRINERIAFNGAVAGDLILFQD